MEQKKHIKNPFFPNGVRHKGLGGFDQFYKSIKIVDVVKKTGEGEGDYVIKKKVIVEKTPIEEVVQADKDNVGVYSILAQFAKTGDTSLLPMEKEGNSVDLVGAPESLMEMKQAGVDAEAMFAKLPKSLRGDMDMNAFVSSFTNEQFEKFVQAIVARKQKEEVKENE